MYTLLYVGLKNVIIRGFDFDGGYPKAFENSNSCIISYIVFFNLIGQLLYQMMNKAEILFYLTHMSKPTV